MNDWISVANRLPPEDMVVETKIDNGFKPRNKGKLKRKGNLWFLVDDSMYVYYTPTHWRYA